MSECEAEIGVLEEENHDLKLIRWKIKDFFSLSSNLADLYPSHGFSFAGFRWVLAIYPEGHPKAASGSISVYLWRKKTSTKCSVQVTLHLQKADGSLLNNEKEIDHVSENAYGYHEFLKRSELVESKSDLVPSDVLTIVCTIKKGSPLPAVTAANMKFSELHTLSNNFKDLMEMKKSCDVTLLVKEKSFQVHKSVLIARSPVFSAMFKYEMSESQKGTVDIPDCDEETFGTFLEYLYSGRVEGVSFGSALHLYRTAHKYDVQELKVFCLRVLKKCLTVEGIIDAAILADQYDEDDLMTVIQDFFNEQFNDIISTTEWESLNNRNFRLANKLTKGASSYLLTLKQQNADLLEKISVKN